MGSDAHKSAVGIIAGNGSLPVEVAQALRNRGRDSFILGIAGECGEDILAYDHHIIEWGQLGLLRRLLEERDITQIVLAGGIVKRPEIGLRKMDWEAIRTFAGMLSSLLAGDNEILSGVIEVFENRGFDVCNLATLLPELFVKEGENGGPRPAKKNIERIRHGAEVTKALGTFDIGQAAVVVGRRVVAVEGVEGTDAMLRRVADLRDIGRLPRKMGGILYKSVKPGQDERADLPTIGPETVRQVFAAGLDGIGVDADKTIMIEREKTLELAQRHRIFIYGMVHEQE